MGFKNWFKDAIGHDDSKPEVLIPIATTSWINVYYYITFHPSKMMSKKEIEEQVNKEYRDLIQIVSNQQIVFGDDKYLGFSNPVIQNWMLIYQHPKQIYVKTFERNFTFQIIKSKEKGCYDYVVKTKERDELTKKELDKLNKQEEIKLAPIKKGQKVIYGYSPVDFIKDKEMLFELDKHLTEYFRIIDQESLLTLYFNKKGEPIWRIKLGCLFFDYNMKDRIKLKSQCPKIHDNCFGDLDEFISMLKKLKPKHKKMNNKKWLKEVDKLRLELKN